MPRMKPNYSRNQYLRTDSLYVSGGGAVTRIRINSLVTSTPMVDSVLRVELEIPALFGKCRTQMFWHDAMRLGQALIDAAQWEEKKRVGSSPPDILPTKDAP